MLDIRRIKENPEEVIDLLGRKGKDAREAIERILELDGQRRVLESYVSHDCGNSYQLEQLIRAIDPIKQPDVKIWRPTVPIYAQDNLPLYWHEGTYSAHTGGWHCDEVMLVEYDD